MSRSRKIEINVFNGLLPATHERLLPETIAQVAENVVLDSGKLNPLHGLTQVQAVAAGTKTIYKYREYLNSTAQWLTFTDEVDIVSSPVNADNYERIFYTGHSGGKLRQKGIDGGVSFDENVYITPPSGAPSPVVTNLFDLSSATGDAYFYEWDGAAWGYTSHNLEFKSVQIAGKSYIATFTMPNYEIPRYDPNHDPSMYFRITLPGGIGQKTVSDLGAEYNLTDNTVTPNVDYASVTLSAINGNTGWDTYGTSFTYNERTVTVQLEMEGLFGGAQDYYYFQSFVNKRGQEGPIVAIDKPEMGSYPTRDNPTGIMYMPPPPWKWEPPTNGVVSDNGISVKAYRGPTDRVVLGNLVSPTSGENITKRRIYRSATGQGDDAVFNMVAELDIAVSSWTDWNDVPGMVYENRVNPPDNLVGMLAHPAKFLVAWVGDSLWVSESNLPHSWPKKYVCDRPIVGAEINGNDIVVLTTGTPTVLSGNNPHALRMAKMPLQQSCVSKKSVCKVGHTVAYASPDGMVFISGGMGEVVTTQISPKQWKSYGPENCVAIQYNGQIYVSMANKNIIIDPDGGANAITTFTESFSVGVNDLVDDSFYIIKDDFIQQFDSDADNPYRLRWQCRDVDYGTPVELSKVRVIAESYDPNINLLVYVNGSLHKNMIIQSEKVYNLPKRRRDEVWSFEIQSNTKVIRVEVGQSMGDFENVE